MAKLLIIPYTCLVEYLWLSQVFPAPVILSIAVVVGGVGVVTVTDLSVTFPGFVVAAMSVLTTGTMQITCNSIQKKHGISSASLLLKAGLPMVSAKLLYRMHSGVPYADFVLFYHWLDALS